MSKKFAFEYGGRSIYVIYKLKHPQILDAINERRTIMLRQDTSQNDDLNEVHITLFSFQINTYHPNCGIFYSKDFRDNLSYAFDKYLCNENLIHVTNHYKILNDFYGKEFQLENPEKITEFRTYIYEYINKVTGFESDIKLENGIYYIGINGQNLLAIPDFNYGKGNWTPHISICKFKDNVHQQPSLCHNNRYLYYKIKKELDTNNETNLKNIVNKYIDNNKHKYLTNKFYRGIKRYNVVPFKNIKLNRKSKLILSMNRNNPNFNWDI